MAIGKILGIAILLLSFVISILIIRKFVRAKTKFKRIVFSILIFIVTTAIMTSFSVTMENLICKFDTAERAFKFNHSEEIIDIVDGESSCMVIYTMNKSTIGVYYLYKSDTNFKIPNFFSSKKVKNILNTNIGFSVDRVLGTNDYYIHGLTTLSESNNYISNDKGDSFGKFILASNVNNVKTFFVYDYIGNYETDDYCLVLNDKRIDIKEEKETPDTSLMQSKNN